MSTYPPEEPKVVFPKNESSWIARNGIWFIPLMIFVIGVPLLCAGSIFFVARAGLGLVLGPKNAAVEAMNDNPAVVAVMGEPIEGSNQIQMRDMQVKDSNGHVELEFDADGPDSDAVVSGKMILDDGEWKVGHITIRFPDGKVIEMGDPVHRVNEAEQSEGFEIDLGGKKSKGINIDLGDD